MIRVVRQKVHLRFRKEARPPAIPLRQDNFIEKLDTRVRWFLALAFVQKFIEGLRLL